MTVGTVNSDRVINRIEGMTKALQPRVARLITAFAVDVTALTKKKLSDDLLHVRTGRLRRSITYKVTESSGAVTGTVGTNVEYARRLEIGFKGQESVRSFVREQVMAFGKAITPVKVTVKAFTRNVNVEGHHFLSSSLQEMKPQLTERLRKLGVMP